MKKSTTPPTAAAMVVPSLDKETKVEQSRNPAHPDSDQKEKDGSSPRPCVQWTTSLVLLSAAETGHVGS